jgi:hypothetical protein
VQTAAHVPFVKLIMLGCLEGNFDEFNDQVKYAHYSQKFDICLLPASSQTCDNGLFKPPSENNDYTHWNGKCLYSNCLVIKIGAKTGVTSGKYVGFFETIKINEKEYMDVFKVESDFYQFSDHGDSGAVYFTFNELGLIPFAIHRCGSDEGKFGYGCALSGALEEMKSAIHFTKVEFA